MGFFSVFLFWLNLDKGYDILGEDVHTLTWLVFIMDILVSVQ